MSRLFWAGISAGFFIASPASSIAAETADGSEIIVTATRTTQTTNEALSSVSVITREDIESSQAQTLLDLLQHQAGIDILRNGGPGQQTSLFLRGSNSDHTLVMVDGVRVASSTTGAFQWENISPNQIERIEVVRGARSALYGSEALGGVIHIFTRKSRTSDVKIITGSFGTTGAEVSTGFGGKTRFHINAGYKQAEGFSAQKPSGSSYDADNDGYVQKNIGLGLNTQLSDMVQLEVSNWNAQNYTQFDKGESDSKNHTIRGTLNITPGSRLAHRLSIDLFQDDLHTYNSSRITTERKSVTWQADFTVSTDTLIVMGADARIDHGKNINLGTSATVFDNTVNNTAAFVSLQKNYSANSIEFSGRHDTHSAFGAHLTGQVAWGRKLGDRTRMYASYGTGFKAPDLNELYHPGYSGFYAGNPALKPEQSSNAEIGLKQQLGRHRFDTSLFHNRISNLINYSGASSQAINIDKAVMYGMEFGHKYVRDKWSLNTQMTLQRSRNEITGAALLKRTNEKLSVQLKKKYSGGLRAMTELFYSSGHEEYGSVIIPAYGVVNMAIQKSFGGNWSWEGRIDNLLDHKYETSPGYNTVPRSFLVSLHYRPGT